MPHSPLVPPEPIARVVLLGASNLRLGLTTILRHARNAIGGPVEFYVANGFGRSYGRWSSVPGRALPGIVECQLWDDLSRRPTLPTFAVLTDVGNDLVYGVDPDLLIEWVSQCTARLVECDTRLVLTQLPIESLRSIGNARFKIFRTIFFPPSQLTLERAIEHAEATNRGLQTVAESTCGVVVAMQRAWYGFDPIHIHWRHRVSAWKVVVDGWKHHTNQPSMRFLSWKNRLSLAAAGPAERRLLGVRRTREQPCTRLRDGSTVALY